MDVSYDQVLDQIFVQLGGFSFHDKAINEMKEKCHELLGTDTMERECMNRKSLSYLLLDMDAL